MLTPAAFASLMCAFAIVGEGLFMGRAGGKFMKSLKQPAFAPPSWAWAIVGIAYYTICFCVLFRLVTLASDRTAPLLLMILLMTANTLWNFVYFRLRRLSLVFWYSVAYSVLAVALLLVLIRHDRAAAFAFSIYVAYLPYALTIFYRTWKLNPAAEK